MDLDKVMMIPFLSKELGLIGYPELPYEKKLINKKLKNKYGPCATVQDVKIIFDKKEMINSLLNTCMDLVKETKKFHEYDYKDDQVHKMTFDNQKLKRQLDAAHQEISVLNEKLSIEKEKYRQLNCKFEENEKLIKVLKDEKKKSDLGNKMTKDLLDHELKRKEADLNEVHTILWKKFNIVDKDYIPKNFEIVKSDNPDLRRLWGDVKYSGQSKKENILKSAICKFQENNELMFEDNILLKSVLLTTLEEINDFISLIKSNLKLSIKNLSNEEVLKIFRSFEGTNVEMYKNYLNSHLNFLKILFIIFDETKFQIGDEMFICLSDCVQKTEEALRS